MLEYDTAGDPITGLKWSRRTTDKIAMALADFGVIVSPNTVARLLHKMGYSLRVNHKKLSTDFSPHRDEQFLYLTDLRHRFQRRGLPIISVDRGCKPKPRKFLISFNISLIADLDPLSKAILTTTGRVDVNPARNP